MRVTAKFRFCAAHRLMNHTGQCRYVHGHNYVAEVDIESAVTTGLVVDFDDLQSGIGGWIAEHWDHAYLHQRGDCAVVLEDQPMFEFMGPPTAENMALRLRVAALEWVEESGQPSYVRVGSVRIWETPDLCAEVDE
jgi:6-pyruvoyltetrahydropterin/6-carboxytetrahydropterin synthase